MKYGRLGWCPFCGLVILAPMPRPEKGVHQIFECENMHRVGENEVLSSQDAFRPDPGDTSRRT